MACPVTARLGTTAAAVSWRPEGVQSRGWAKGGGAGTRARLHSGRGKAGSSWEGAFPRTQLAGAQVEAKHRGPLTTCGGCKETGGLGCPGGACLS